MRDERNANDRTPADPSDTKSAQDDRERAVDRTDREEEHPHPLKRLHFGSAGSGGAENEPGPERP